MINIIILYFYKLDGLKFINYLVICYLISLSHLLHSVLVERKFVTFPFYYIIFIYNYLFTATHTRVGKCYYLCYSFCIKMFLKSRQLVFTTISLQLVFKFYQSFDKKISKNLTHAWNPYAKLPPMRFTNTILSVLEWNKCMSLNYECS